MNACIELLIRILLELLKYFIENWLQVLVVIAIISWITNLLKEATLLLGLFASALNMGGDFLFGSTGGLSIPVNVIISLAIAVLWVTMVNQSSVNALFKVINTIIVFITGFIWGMVALPIPLSIAIAIALRFRITNYMLGIIPTLQLLFLVFFPGTLVCRIASYIIKFIS